MTIRYHRVSCGWWFPDTPIPLICIIKIYGVLALLSQILSTNACQLQLEGIAIFGDLG